MIWRGGGLINFFSLRGLWCKIPPREGMSEFLSLESGLQNPPPPVKRASEFFLAFPQSLMVVPLNVPEPPLLSAWILLLFWIWHGDKQVKVVYNPLLVIMVYNWFIKSTCNINFKRWYSDTSDILFRKQSCLKRQKCDSHHPLDIRCQKLKNLGINQT